MSETIEQKKQRHAAVQWTFPHTLNWGDGSTSSTSGMPLRDWFAGQHLGGLASDHHFNGTAESAAECAYAYADAMLKARAK